MKAITQDTYGQADVLQFKDIDMPVAGPDEVLIRIRAAAIDAGTWHLMTGEPYLLRLGFGLKRPKVPVRGREMAGTIEAAGANVTDFKPGDDVVGTATNGTFAEYVTATTARLAPKPASLSFEQAAAIPISGITAVQAVRDTAKIQAGQKVLVIGAAGGVGTYIVQLAKAFGAEVTGVCSTAKTELVQSIGADHVIDYTSQQIPAGRYDVVFDIAGNRKLTEVRRALTPKGMLVLVGGENGGIWLGGMERVLGATLLSPFVSHRLRNVLAIERRKDLEFLIGMIEDGKVKPVIGRTCGLAEVPGTIKDLQAGSARGKTVVII
ncbi:NADPH:quinone reductase-like Zn-dependent oxidoreductase [Kibdelosporangium banguiense]|uniref:NADPH:quinone reductase-like Zn-dependent oxidoreductase n=1 Tax=Kibdelosporangium banguiense TaxID=1365924 RepID=A0ABS4TUQ5_9PSEU|nr:NAD(P)-dependent alcohol dehydrogenase [Kibdelosporangium banguiense]MBP2327671.1 NADPH:quinone reductase-like Zn-dependent oxidoreductase [Kibdelosporangium banguiense]